MPQRPLSAKWGLSSGLAPTLLSATDACFLGERGPCATPRDWNAAGKSKLWLYNLHYFDDLNAVGDNDDTRHDWHVELLGRWMRENPIGSGNGWEPYPTSRRIANWTKWCWRRSDESDVEGISESLATQAVHLSRNVEHHILGNHILANAKALVFAGVFFRGPQADALREHGLRLLARELGEQILDDGGHFELSPMYHCIVLQDVLDLIHLAQISALPDVEAAAKDWSLAAQRMLAWLDVTTHPDGGIAFLNDACFGVAPTPDTLRSNAASLGLEPSPAPQHRRESTGPLHLQHNAHSGYVQLANESFTVIADVAAVGPTYLPGHGHADTLSFELSAFGQRVVVNSGIDRYGVSEERLRQRGTAAKSTVQINDANSSEVWSGFRVARRAKPFDVNLRLFPDALHLGAAHDGYMRNGWNVVHRRRWRLTSDSLVVTDVVDGRAMNAVCRIHLHPNVDVVFTDADTVVCAVHEAGGGRRHLRFAFWGHVRVDVADTTHHPRMGCSVKSHSIVVIMPTGSVRQTLRCTVQPAPSDVGPWAAASEEKCA